MSDDWERYKSGEISEKEYHRLKHAADRERRNAVSHEYYKAHRIDIQTKRYEWHKRHKNDPDYQQKRKIRSDTRTAIRSGWLIRPDACPRCGATDRPIEAHHKHYDRPDSAMDVEFMCEPCHTKEHQNDVPTVP